MNEKSVLDAKVATAYHNWRAAIQKDDREYGHDHYLMLDAAYIEWLAAQTHHAQSAE